MPMVKKLESVHQELMDIAKESNRLSHTKYSEDDIEKLQERLRAIDSQYREGAFGEKASSDVDRYEEEGLAQVSDELEKVHTILHRMLARLE
ncbi:uncharacterized protein BX663DRAFT_454729 [Cokeromyces recurvatus]|uniref:uncharacterized protein n=1 Tax=Cokeromyces recurvatus TaxID=90255 RepID=UPI002220792F|nr:uncharacterized protein BX663DRAFT_454729 [Cokeromyces recurvatus]KAI7902657.1 hypothetical protein BX663DRAFT_454729 [Cokeromyces recurvatus]